MLTKIIRTFVVASRVHQQIICYNVPRLSSDVYFGDEMIED